MSEETGKAAESAGRWPRVERLDARRLAEGVRDASGVLLAIEGPCQGGEVGACYVRWPDGRRSVLTWLPGSTVERLRSGSLAVIGALRPHGYPAPAAELTVQVGDGVAVVWELLPGAPVARMTMPLLDRALGLNVMQRGRLAGRRQVPAVNLYLTGDGPGFCLHEPMRQYSERTRRLERWVMSVGAAHPGLMAGDDAVHLDYTPHNMLARGGQISGVIDWDGAGRGDCRLDIVTLRFGMHALPPDPEVTDRLDRLLDGFPPEVLAPMWAHMSLRMTDWVIRHYDDDRVEHWLALAERRAG